MANKVLLGEMNLSFTNVMASRVVRTSVGTNRAVLSAVTKLKDIGAETVYTISVGGPSEITTEHRALALYLYNVIEEQFDFTASTGSGFDRFLNQLSDLNYEFRVNNKLPQWMIDDVRY